MSFFRPSFENFGETLRTVSLVIGLLVTSLTGVGYAYTLISDQKAMAVEITNLDSRVTTIEAEKPVTAVDRQRISGLETSVDKLGVKMEKMQDFLADFRAEVSRKLN